MEGVQSFEEYLISKKIDVVKFESEEPDQFSVLKNLFDEMSPNSFTQQKLFLINPIRRKYTLAVEQPVVTAKPKASFRPKMSK